MKPGSCQKILIISIYYSPKQLVGAKRFTYLSQKFEISGYQTHILTLGSNQALAVDNTMPVPGITHEVNSLLPFPVARKNIFYKLYYRFVESLGVLFDPHIGWLIPAVIQGFRVIRKNKIDTIVVTAPPFTPMIVAALLQKITGARLILDYRDPWMANDWKERRYTNILIRSINTALERWVVSKANEIVVVSEYMQNEFKKHYKHFPESQLHVVTNAFVLSEETPQVRFNNRKKNILYAGNFYGERKISIILKPLSQLFKDGIASKEDIKLNIFGKLLPEDMCMVAEYGFEDIVEVHEPVSHEVMYGYIKSADILLLISGADVIYALPYKIFDYIGGKRPILAVAPEKSAIHDLMCHGNFGEFADIYDEHSIKHALNKLLNATNDTYDFKGRDSYSLEKTSAKYISIIDSTIHAV